MRRQINEILDSIFSGPEETRQDRFDKELKDTSFLLLMKMAYLPDFKIQGIPEGAPPLTKAPENLPEGLSDTTVRGELRRIKSFLVGGSAAGLSQPRREAIWMQILEGIHPREVPILTAIKDQTLDDFYLVSELLVKYGFPGINKPEKPKKASKKTSKKKDASTSPTPEVQG